MSALIDRGLCPCGDGHPHRHTDESRAKLERLARAVDEAALALNELIPTDVRKRHNARPFIRALSRYIIRTLDLDVAPDASKRTRAA